MIAALALFLAAIVSDDAKMFISGGEWLPDQVPNRAYYDAADPAGKELRLTTNVAAAVASCYSGLCERALPSLAETGWWEYYGPEMWGMESFKTNMLWIDYGGSYHWLAYPSNRAITSYKVLDYGQLDRLRATLCDIVNGDVLDYAHYGSSKLRGYPFPTWDWDPRSPTVIVPDWTRVWPQFTACTNDGVWRTETHPVHDCLDSALSFYDFGPFDDLYDLREYIETNAIPDSCYRILEDRLGTNAQQFASDTHRLSYCRLGAIETAIAAIDTTYGLGDLWPLNQFVFERQSYFHQRGYQNTQMPDVSIDWDNETVTLSGDLGWRAYEIFTNNTQEAYSYSHPAFVCCGDTPVGHQIVSGSSAIVLTWSMLRDAGITPGHEGFITPTISAGELELYTIDSGGGLIGNPRYSLPVKPWTVLMTAGVTRQIDVGYTSMLATNDIEYVRSPHPWLWSRGMVSNDVSALEYRVCCTNALPGSDTGGWSFYWFGDDAHGERAETRSNHLGGFLTTNAYMQAWRAERLRHRSAVSNMLGDFLGCSLTDRENLIPIPDATCEAMRDSAAAATNGVLSASLAYAQVYVEMAADGGSCTITCQRPDSTWLPAVALRQGEELPIGMLLFTAIDRTDVPVRLKGRPPCYSWGDLTPACRIRWRFQNLRDE